MTETPPSSPQPTPLTDEEVRRRIKGLIKLGNAPKVAELILLQAGATPEQVKAAIQDHQREKQTEVKEQGFLGWIIVLGSAVVILVVLYLWLNWPGENPKTPAPTSAPPGYGSPHQWLAPKISRHPKRPSPGRNARAFHRI